MIEGILHTADGKKYKLYKSPDIRKKHTDFECYFEMDKGMWSYVVWEEIPEKKD